MHILAIRESKIRNPAIGWFESGRHNPEIRESESHNPGIHNLATPRVSERSPPHVDATYVDALPRPSVP